MCMAFADVAVDVLWLLRKSYFDPYLVQQTDFFVRENGIRVADLCSLVVAKLLELVTILQHVD